jgi:thiol:disulfide interchange protein/DsbC/DsbD-like thiol-disulfide interchange protein
MHRILPFLVAALAAAPAWSAPVRAPHIEAELVAEHTAWLPGADNPVALRLKPDAGWHTYWRNPGDSGLPTALIWSLPGGWSAGEIHWPYPKPYRLGELVNYGYGEDTLHLVTLSLPRMPEGGEVTVHAEARWLVCSDICIPGSAELSLTLPVSEIATVDPAWGPRFRETRGRLPDPDPLPAIFEIAEGEFRIAIDTGDARLAQATQTGFFPYLNDLVNHGALQRSALEPASLRFAQALSTFYTGVPEPVEGVLVVTGVGGTRAYTVSAQAGTVATVDMPVLAAGETAADAPVIEPIALWLALGFALLGGLILNLMPCVFPVLSIKAVSMLEAHAGDAPGRRMHALAYTVGVVLSCAGLAGVLIALRAAGGTLGWGFQLQSPLFIATLAYLIFALGLSLSGVVQIGTRFMGVGQSLTEQGGYSGSFFTGVLATVVATPCTAPFMGAALGYALVQPAPVALLVFVMLGLGLALPFLLLGWFPGVARVLPKPGAWMETFKQVMAFPLYLTVVWLLWVLGRQAGVDAVALALLGLTGVALALWLWGAAAPGPVRGVMAVLAGFGALALLAHPLLRTAPAAPSPAAESLSSQHGIYSDAMLQTLRAEGRAVFVNFTADWCITCKVNERVALESARVREAFAARDVVWLTADWTRPNPEITAALERFGRSGVPLYLLYPPGEEAVVLPQILTPEIVIEAVNQLP